MGSWTQWAGILALAGGALLEDPGRAPGNVAGGASCQTGPQFFDFGPHRDDPEAEQLAMILTGELRAPDEEYERIAGDLLLIRAAHPELSSVVDDPEYAADQMLVKLDPGLPWSGYESSNLYYQVIDEDHLFGDWYTLTFCDNVNAEALAVIYADLPEVLFAEPNYLVGTDDRITITLDGTTYRYEVVDGFHDCFDGCDCARIWVVEVDQDGTIDVISYDEGGQSWCAFPRSCCLPDESCGVMEVAACQGQGGVAQGFGLFCDQDSDGDGLDAACGDNCPTDANPDQANHDGDGAGDVCDPDDDGDGVLDDGDGSGQIGDNPCPPGQTAGCDDNCQFVANPSQADGDHDGSGFGCDCAPGNPDTHPGAIEVNDGLDNQCSGDPGYGVIDETSGDSGFHDPEDKNEYSWPAQPGATEYEVVRSVSPLFPAVCTTWLTAGTSVNDTATPSPAEVFHYLNRPTAPNTGSWGQDSAGAERTNVCP